MSWFRRAILALQCAAFCSVSAQQARPGASSPTPRRYSEEFDYGAPAAAATPPPRTIPAARPRYSEEFDFTPAPPPPRAGPPSAGPKYSEEFDFGVPAPAPLAPAPPKYSEEFDFGAPAAGPRIVLPPAPSEELELFPLDSAGNPQQPPMLPQNPLPPGSEEMPLFGDDLPLLRMDPFTLDAGVAPAPVITQRMRLDAALAAVEPLLPPSPDLSDAFGSSPKVLVKRYVFEGNHVFNSFQLRKVVAPYAGREITPEELEEARVAVTKHYVEAGYITSGAVLPDQDVRGGVVRMQIVEGRLTEIDIRGNKWYRAWWLRHMMRRAAGKPFSFPKLRLGTQLLRQQPTVERINAEVKPGAKPGESLLEFVIKDKHPFRAGFELSNKRPPSIGEGLGELYFTDLNLTGHTDVLDLRWGVMRWRKDGTIEYGGLDNIFGAYDFPISPWGTRLALHASRSDASVISEQFAELGITSRNDDVGFDLRQPIVETLNNTITLSIGADRKHSETFLFDRPFTLAIGAIDGETTVFATRAAIDWVNRSQQHVLALRSVFSFGFYGLDSSRADPRLYMDSLSGGDPLLGLDPEIPDSKFFAWLGQAQLVARVFDTPTLRKKPDTRLWNLLREITVVARGNVQLADEPLLALEQFSLGGMQSVRGYRENQILRDNGLFGSLEVRVPLWLAADKTPIIAVAPFFDIGSGWNVNKLDDQYELLYSAGLGLIARPSKYAQILFYWGHAFHREPRGGESLQDGGVHFAVSINAF